MPKVGKAIYPITQQTDFDWIAAMVDLRKMSDVQFRQCWLAIVMDTCLQDDEVTPRLLGMMLAVVRERYAKQLGVDHRVYVCSRCNVQMAEGQSGDRTTCQACEAKP